MATKPKRRAVENAQFGLSATPHIPTPVPVASGAGYIKCSCGWQSKVENDGDMFEPERYCSKDAFLIHLKRVRSVLT